MEIMWFVVAVITAMLTNIVCARTVIDRLAEDSDWDEEVIYVSSCLGTLAISFFVLLMMALQEGVCINFWASLFTLAIVPASWIGLITVCWCIKGFFRGFANLLPKLSQILNKQIDRVFSFKKILFNRSKKTVLQVRRQAHEIKRLEALVSELSLQLESKPGKQETAGHSDGWLYAWPFGLELKPGESNIPGVSNQLPAVLAAASTPVLREKLVQRRRLIIHYPDTELPTPVLSE